MPNERVTITLPADIVGDIDEFERNRSKFIKEAVGRELKRRRREGLRRSLRNPHSESEQVAGAGMDEWAKTLPDEDVTELVDLGTGKKVEWISGRGWFKRRK